jgi:hypothetical protein
MITIRAKEVSRLQSSGLSKATNNKPVGIVSALYDFLVDVDTHKRMAIDEGQIWDETDCNGMRFDTFTKPIIPIFQHSNNPNGTNSLSRQR